MEMGHKFFFKVKSILRHRDALQEIKAEFVTNEPSPLSCLVCGYERAGTTVLTELIRQDPRIDGRFECGFLLADSPQEFPLFEEYAKNLKIAWGLDDEAFQYICASPSWSIVYARMLERSNLPDKTVRIYDKTPRYMRHLTTVLQKVSVPCVVVVKDPRALYWSQFKRNNIMPNKFCQYFHNYANEYHIAKTVYPDRILLVQYEKLCIAPLSEAERIFKFLNLEFHEDHLLLRDKGDPYVTPGGINAKAIYDYRDNLSAEDQDFIVKHTEKYSEWHWNE